MNTDFDIVELTPKYLHEMPCKVKFLGFNIKVPPVNEFGKYVAFKTNRVGLFRKKEDFTIQINHYVSKSYGEYVLRKKSVVLVRMEGRKPKFYDRCMLIIGISEAVSLVIILPISIFQN